MYNGFKPYPWLPTYFKRKQKHKLQPNRMVVSVESEPCASTTVLFQYFSQWHVSDIRFASFNTSTKKKWDFCQKVSWVSARSRGKVSFKSLLHSKHHQVWILLFACSFIQFVGTQSPPEPDVLSLHLNFNPNCPLFVRVVIMQLYSWKVLLLA